jgi:hypothetical protein
MNKGSKMKVSLIPEVINNLLKFKLNAMVVSQSGEYIGHVVGYHMCERSYQDWDTLGRWIYQLKIQWASTIDRTVDYNKLLESIHTVDFNDVSILE